MAERRFTIEEVRARELLSYHERYLETTDRDAPLPINAERALAQSRNPYADEGDVGLLVAMEGNRCIGYLGLLPALVDTDGTEAGRKKVHWLSAFYVVPERREAGVGGALVERAVALDYDLLATAASRQSGSIFGRIGVEFGPLPYAVLRLDRLNLLGLPFKALRRWCYLKGRRPPSLDRVISRTEAFLYPALRRATLAWALREISRGAPPRAFRVPSRVDEAGFEEDGGGPGEGTPFFYRDGRAVTWMLADRWVPEAKAPGSERYFFSAAPQGFAYAQVEVVRGPEPVPTLRAIFSVGADDLAKGLRTLDYRPSDGSGARDLLAAALWVGLREGVDRLELPAECVPLMEARLLTRLVLERRTRNYFCIPRRAGSAVRGLLPRVRLRLADGDTPFV